MIFSVLAFLTLIISICIKNRKKSLTVQSINCVFESLYDFTIHAYTGAFLSLFNSIRSFIFINKDKFSKIFYFILLLIFESIIIANCYFTWIGYISLLPTIGSIIRTYCLWQSNMKLVRLSGLATGILFGLYYVYYQSWFMVSGYVILFISVLIAVYRIDIKKR